MSTPTEITARKIGAELRWLTKNPHFEERPATIKEFVGPGYLDVESRIRKRLLAELIEIVGDEVNGENPTKWSFAMLTGGVGIGKTTIASLILPYLAHWTLCLKDPQGYFGLLPGSRIAFMQMSTSEQQALEVVFGDIKARIEHSEWFRRRYPFDPKFKNQIRFPKNIWIIPGDSAETTFEGYNILGGILDEADSHKVTPQKDYASQGFDTIENRISSRYGDKGFLLVIGQMKKGNGFAAKKYEEFVKRDDAYASRLAIWDSMGDDYYRCKEKGPHKHNHDLPEGKVCGEVHKFAYDIVRKQIIPAGVTPVLGEQSAQILLIPTMYQSNFETNPEKALKDLAGIPPRVGDAFISLTHKIADARDRWLDHHDQLPSPLRPDGSYEPWFHAPDTLKRVGHIDLAYSGEGDALGFAMGHVREVVEIDGELKPYIVFDLLMRIKAPAGGEIFLADIRHKIYDLRDHHGFKLAKITMDGFQSTDTNQQLRRRRFETEEVSVDRQVLPYHDLREAIYEDRVEFPQYMVHLRPGDTELTEIAVKELAELIDAGRKIDHPPDGSKDLADAMAGVVFTLMGERRWRRKVVNMSSYRTDSSPMVAAGGGLSHPAYLGDGGYRAPIPPNMPTGGFPR